MEDPGVNEKAEDEGVTKKKKKKKRSEDVKVDLSCCKYEVLRIVIQKMGWEEAADYDRAWHLFWTDTSIGPERLMTLRRGQKVNHFLGMLQICRKKSLARHLSNMRRMFPAEYKFFPRAFILPNQIQDLIGRLNSERLRTYILKPDNGCQGRGVVLVQSVADLKQAVGGMAGANMLAQKYLTNPMLLNGYKFDLRIYALILSCDPLRLFLYREGIARFCTEKYMKPDKGNLKQSCMHLTNYAVNKYNSNFEFNSSPTETDKGSKWTLSSLFKALAARGYDTPRLKRQIRKMVVMTIIAVVPLLVHNYRNCLNEDDNGRSCFELLGMDVLLDEKCRPWLLEVNHSPSFAIDTPLDFKVKEALLSDTLRLVHIDPLGVSRYHLQDKKGSKMRLYGNHQVSKEDFETPTPELEDCQASPKQILDPDEYEHKNLGNFDRIYPSEDANLQALYGIFLAGSEEAFKQSFDMKVKNAILKAQEERKREEMEREAAEKKKMKKRLEMRKKAQESAKLAAALAQKQASAASNCQDSTNDEALNGLSKELLFGMSSPQSSVETPTDLQRSQSSIERLSLGQKEDRSLFDLPILDGPGSFLQQERTAGVPSVDNSIESRPINVDVDGGTIPYSGPPKTQSMYKSGRYMPPPYYSAPGMPRFSSLPCIVPQALGRQQLRKPCFVRVQQDRTPELDSESLFVRSQSIRNTHDMRRPKNTAISLTRRYYGRLPELRAGPPFPKYGTDPGPFLREPKSIYSKNGFPPPIRAPHTAEIGRSPIDELLGAAEYGYGGHGAKENQNGGNSKLARKGQISFASSQVYRQRKGMVNAHSQSISRTGMLPSGSKDDPWNMLRFTTSALPGSKNS